MSEEEKGGELTAEERAEIISSEKEGIELLIPLDDYLSSGIHIGTHMCTSYMRRFVYKVRPEGLYVLDIRKVDERLRIAAKFISRFTSSSILAVSSRQYGFTPVEKFSKIIGGQAIIGRFVPGTLTNPRLNNYIEPEVLIATDPKIDIQAIKEATEVGIPIVSFASTDAKPDMVDLIIPSNNKGRKSLALLYWILARQILRERKEIDPNANLPVSVAEFEVKVG